MGITKAIKNKIYDKARDLVRKTIPEVKKEISTYVTTKTTDAVSIGGKIIAIGLTIAVAAMAVSSVAPGSAEPITNAGNTYYNNVRITYNFYGYKLKGDIT